MQGGVHAPSKQQVRSTPATPRAVPEAAPGNDVLALQRTHGNQAVLRLLGHASTPSIQRLIDRATFAANLKRGGAGGYGNKSLNNLLDSIGGFHIERARTKDPDAAKLVPILTGILADCEKFLK